MIESQAFYYFLFGMICMFALGMLMDWLLNLYRRRQGRCRGLQCPHCGTPLTHNNLKLFQAPQTRK